MLTLFKLWDNLQFELFSMGVNQPYSASIDIVVLIFLLIPP